MTSLTCVVAVAAALSAASGTGAFPKPSPYPTTWELKVEVASPKRVVVGGKAYWYLTYRVTNETGQERVFLPTFEVMTPDGKVARADRLIPLPVFEAVKQREGIKFLEQYNQISGEVRLGEDEARDGVTIWPEASAEDREFTVFFSGFSGETAKVAGPEGKELTLFKTLQLSYAIPGDARFRDVNEVKESSRSYVMR
jgi:hypothetical protein